MIRKIAILIFALMIPLRAFAQESTPTTVETSEIRGEVSMKDNNTLYVDTNDGTTQVTVPEGVSVKRNTLEASVNDIQPGDDVTIVQSENGVLSVEATAGELFDWGKFLVPALIIALAAALAFWYLLKRNREPHIKTTA